MGAGANYSPFYNFDQAIQWPFANGMAATVNAAMSMIQGPLTALVVVWIIVSGILVMRGDLSARAGVTRILNVSIVAGLLMSTTLYNEYIVYFFTNDLPNWLASGLLGVTGVQPSATQFDILWHGTNNLLAAAYKKIHAYDFLYSVELGLMQVLVIVPIGLTFLIYEVARIMMDLTVAIGPFMLLGYLFAATRGVADRWVGKLISLAILMLLVDIVLSLIIQGDMAYYSDTFSGISLVGAAQAVTLVVQFLMFLLLGTLITVFLPGMAAFLGGGISVSPLAMLVASHQVTRVARGAFPKSPGGGR
ncbi:type IV secretion system protein [Acidiphilium sp.]|uniref:type IV secretion system protein n=1 Tax=Acidiphilium sp. TaxID=527 RepID=UPI00258AA99D|nr:type IV secretion system protein [Acidiphilium sp.]